MIQNKPALKSHLLASILPFQQIKSPREILKNKEFYKPEQFIWNNPHRTSKRLYPYYHQFNQEYDAKIKPIIEKLEQSDRISNQQQRIKKLTKLRAETRLRFFERQKDRQLLEANSNSKKKVKSIAELHQYNRLEQNTPFEEGQKNLKSRASYSKSSAATINIEKTYQKGLQNYDQSLDKIRKLVSDQISKNQSKIRFQFQKRKQNNDRFSHSFTKTKGRKSLGALRLDNYIHL